jgi:hypothetical protein
MFGGLVEFFGSGGGGGDRRYYMTKIDVKALLTCSSDTFVFPYK